MVKNVSHVPSISLDKTHEHCSDNPHTHDVRLVFARDMILSLQHNLQRHNQHVYVHSIAITFLLRMESTVVIEGYLLPSGVS